MKTIIFILAVFCIGCGKVNCEICTAEIQKGFTTEEISSYFCGDKKQLEMLEAEMQEVITDSGERIYKFTCN